MSRMLIAGLIILFAASACFPASTASDTLAWGPENGGLRMNLQIDPAEANQPDCYKVTVRIANVSKAPVVLGTLPDMQTPLAQDYRQYIRDHVYYSSFPEIVLGDCQTAGIATARVSTPSDVMVKPGDSLISQWTTERVSLNPKGSTCRAFGNLQFPANGLYSIRARLVVQGGRHILYSNDCQLAVGGSRAMPKLSTARVFMPDPNNGTVRLDVGSYGRIEPNDVFACGGIGEPVWRVVVKEVYPSWSLARVTIASTGPVPPDRQPMWLVATAPGTLKGGGK